MKKAGFFLQSVVNSYAILFFSQNRVLGVLLLIVSFFDVHAGLAGFVSVLVSLALVNLLGYVSENIRMGSYSFNALLLGIGMGTFFHFSGLFFIWLMVGCATVTMLSVILFDRFYKVGMPLLSIPFLLTFWLILSASYGVFTLNLEQQNSAILNEVSNVGEGRVDELFSQISLPAWLSLFFRALSAILFQNNVFAGAIIAIGLLVHSRIMFSLLAITFAVTLGFNYLTNTYPGGISYYHLGSNVMMAAAAIGSFFLISSWRSYLWALISIPVTVLIINATTRLFGDLDLPVFSLPFCLTLFLFTGFFRLRINAGKLQLTLLQNYSPELNLYQFVNNSERLNQLNYLGLNLPFMGEWSVSQGYDGGVTHKADWGKALDFVIKDEDAKTYRYPGTQPGHFYCYNKPVLAVADGTVEEVVGYIDDNAIGEVNTTDNWGNSVVIKHGYGLYSKVSHLKKDSLKVKTGDFVKQGDVLGMCGNSGRSPEPHLHFQVQATPFIGSKTLVYPFAYYLNNSTSGQALHCFDIPQENQTIAPLKINGYIKKAFTFQPGYTAIVSAGNKHEQLEVFTDALNQSYFYSEITGATAWFVNNGSSFYFTGFYGDRSSLLYQFYIVAYKVIFSDDEAVSVEDTYPIQTAARRPLLWLHDLLAPFCQFIRVKYSSRNRANGQLITIEVLQHQNNEQTMDAAIYLNGGSIQSFAVNTGTNQTEAKWTVKEE